MHVELQNVCKAYGKVRALDRLFIDLDPGKVVAVLGSNGAGKSTLLRILSGIIQPDDGGVLYDGQRLALDNLDLRRRIFFLPDFPPVFPGESVLSNIGLLLRIYEADGRAVLCDPFHGGAPLSDRDCLQYLAQHGLPFEPRWFDDASDLAIFGRHVGNLPQSYSQRGLEREVRLLASVGRCIAQRTAREVRSA